MSESLNWVERRARRESNLSQAVEVWESVRTAISDCCESFNENYPHIGQVKHQPENGRRVRVIVTFNAPQRVSRNIAIEFSKGDKDSVITCTVDGGAAKKFSILADENHAFLKYANQEISPDRLTEIALEDALFKLPSPPSPRRNTRSFAQTQSDPMEP